MKLKTNEFYSARRAHEYMERRRKEFPNETFYIATFNDGTGRTVYGVYR